MLKAVPINRHLIAADLVETIAYDVRRERTRQALYLSEAAQEIGVTTPTLLRLEQGLNKPSWSTIILVLRWLGR